MSIKYKVLGKPGRDNALFIWIDSGTKICRMLFDCGENIFYKLRQADIKGVDYLLFSHLHIDHIAGFDYYFRRNFDRAKPNIIWGPEETSVILQNRLQGFKWNLLWDAPGEFIINDVLESEINTYKFITSEKFSERHIERTGAFNFHLFENPEFTLNAVILNHSIPSIAYSVVEKDSLNISKDALEEAGLTPGSWLEKVKDFSVSKDFEIETDNRRIKIGELRSSLLRISKGEKISYLTDFLFDKTSADRAVKLIKESDVVICESQYHHDDAELALRNFHLTSRQAAELAKEANVKKLILFHISERYTSDGSYQKLLDDARTVFPETYFPEEWTAS